jgi:hypothetical protein
MNTQYAMKRLPSQKRHIWGAIIGGAITAASAIITSSARNKKEKKQREETEKEARLEDASLQLEEQQAVLDDYNTEGELGIEYYANGGKLNMEKLIASKLGNPSRGITSGRQSASGYDTTGGALVPIGEGIEKAIGNKHSENDIDGSYGITLSKNGQPQAEIEDEEIVADGQRVYSDQLKYDKNHTYADKMEKITKERNKLEGKLDHKTNRRTRNSIERKLGNLNLAEETLFTEQEMHKLIKGEQQLQKMANDGIIEKTGNRKFPDGGKIDPRKPASISFLNDDSRSVLVHMNENALVKGKGTGFQGVPVETTIDTTKLYNNFDEEFYVPYYKKQLEGIPIESIDNLSQEDRDKLFDKYYYNRIDKKGKRIYGMSRTEEKEIADYIKKKGKNKVDERYKGNSKKDNIPTYAGGGEMGSWWETEAGQNTQQLGTAAIDNIVNLALTTKTPKLSKPLYERPQNLKTDYNVNPQLAAVRRATRVADQTAMDNSSSSSNVRSQIAANRLRGAEMEAGIYADKENKETAMYNADVANKMAISKANNAISRDYANSRFMRANEIQSRISANAQDFAKDASAIVTNNMKRNVEDEILFNEIAADPTGAKLRAMLNSPYIQQKMQNDPAFKARMEGLIMKRSSTPLDASTYGTDNNVS